MSIFVLEEPETIVTLSALVTGADVDNAEQGDPERDPIAIAIRRRNPELESVAVIGASGVNVIHRDGRKGLFRLTPGALRKVYDYSIKGFFPVPYSTTLQGSWK